MTETIKLLVRPCALLLAAAVTPAPAFAGCGTASCTANTSWDVQGVSEQPGVALDLRYEFIDQNQLRAGSGKTSIDTGEATEKQTINRNLAASLDYAAANWGVTVSVPYYASRSHVHVLNDTQETETWRFSRLGDVRVLGRYQFNSGPFENRVYGIKFGAKLPTGAIDMANAEGMVAERALQPGTGSTDALLGGYFYQGLPGRLAGWFTQALWQHAVATRDGFRPGDQVLADVGLRYILTDKWNAILQLNALHKERDSGPNAEPDVSGGNFVFLSPGLSYAMGKSTQIYAFAQKPLYQYVNGTQLTADWTAVAGISHRF